MLDGNDIVIAGLAHRAQQIGPGRGFAALPNGGEMPGRFGSVARRSEMQNAMPADTLLVQDRVLAMHPADAIANILDDGHGIDALPPEVTGVEIDPDIAPGISGQRLESGGVEHGDARMHLEADHQLRRFLGQPRAGFLPKRSDHVFHLPGENLLIVGRGGPAGKDAECCSTRTRRTAAHGHHALDAHGHRQIDSGVKAGLRILAFGGIGMQKIPRGIDGGEPDPMFFQLTLQAIALRRSADGGEIEMRARPWTPGADTDLHILDAVLGAPGQHGLARKFRKRVREYANSHRFAFLDAESKSSTSRRAPATVVWTGALPVAAAWKARNSSRKASS